MNLQNKQISDLAKNWVKRPVSPEKIWRPFKNEDWAIDGESIQPNADIVAQRNETIEPSETMLSPQCVVRLREDWKGVPASHIASSGSNHWHCYKISSHPCWQPWKQGHSAYSTAHPDVWWCSNLLDASNRYSWPENDVGPFAPIALALQTAIQQKTDLYAAAICHVILRWGGVYNRAEKLLEWIDLQVEKGSLCQALIDATRRLVPQSQLNLSIFDGRIYFMDSSSTKIYAALGLDLSGGLISPKQDILIYDGRVAGALALFTRRLLAGFGYASVPSMFQFPVERPYGTTKRRNPSRGNFQFPAFNYGSTQAGADSHFARAHYARLASRFIQQVIGINCPSTEFLDIEKGLFMVGYDVSEDCRRIPHT